MTERDSKNHGLLQVQYAFLELPKMPARAARGRRCADLWAWLFVHAPELTEVPADLPPGPYGEALELANKAKFTVTELQAYEKARDEIRQVLEIAAEREAAGFVKGKLDGLREGKLDGLREGKLEAKRETLLRVLVRARIALTERRTSSHRSVQGCGDPRPMDR